jgi:DNA-binding response OmpR family regulator
MAPVLVRRPNTTTQPRRPAAATGPAPSQVELNRFRRLLAALPVAPTLELAPRRRGASLNGRHVILAKREFALLAFLAYRAPGVATREDIAQAVWRDATKAFSRTIDVHVARLRDKLGQAELILTERGQGYRLNPNLHIQAAS